MKLYREAWLKAKDAGDDIPKASEYIGECILKIAQRLAYRPNFINYCVDPGVEALTKRGWLKYNELTLDDIILSCDPNTRNLVWSRLKEIYINEDFDGKMFHLSSNGFDSIVTPGHRWLTEEQGLVPVEKLRIKDHVVLLGNALDDNSTKKYTDAFVELVGWAVTEGCYFYGKRIHEVRIAQKKQSGIDSIRRCLNDLNAHWKEYKQKNTYTNEKDIQIFHISGNIANSIIAVAPGKTKVLSYDFINNLTKEQRNLLVQTMISGDGYRTTDKNNGRISEFYTQKDRKHIDSFVALCTMAGLVTTVKFNEKMKTKFGDSDIHLVRIRSSKKCSVSNVNFHGGRVKLNRFGAPSHIPTYDYKGVVWCPVTEYGSFVCRRNDKVFVTGNSFRSDMICDAIENCFQYLGNFDPEKTNNPFAYFSSICWYAFIRRIQKEKKQSYIKCKIADINGYMDDEYTPETKSWKEKSDEIITTFEKTMNIKKSGKAKKGLENFMYEDNGGETTYDESKETL